MKRWLDGDGAVGWGPQSFNGLPTGLCHDCSRHLTSNSASMTLRIFLLDRHSTIYLLSYICSHRYFQFTISAIFDLPSPPRLSFPALLLFLGLWIPPLAPTIRSLFQRYPTPLRHSFCLPRSSPATYRPAADRPPNNHTSAEPYTDKQDQYRCLSAAVKRSSSASLCSWATAPAERPRFSMSLHADSSRFVLS